MGSLSFLPPHLLIFLAANYRSVVLAAYKFLSLLRSSGFDSFHYEELVKLSHIRFRFQEKRPPDDYATWITEHMAWPVPPELLLAAPRLTYSYEDENDRQRGEAKISEYLQSFRVGEGRVVLMAKKDDHIKVQPDLQWQKEPWYGTEYAVQRWDAEFVNEVRSRVSSSIFFTQFAHRPTE